MIPHGFISVSIARYGESYINANQIVTVSAKASGTWLLLSTGISLLSTDELGEVLEQINDAMIEIYGVDA